MDPGRIISEIAKRDGVLINRTDPVMQVATMISLFVNDHEQHEAKQAAREEKTIAALSQVLEQAQKQAGGELARTAAGELPKAIDRLTVQRWSGLAVGAGLLIAATAAGFYSLGHRSGYAAGTEMAIDLKASIGRVLTRDEAAQWATLIQYNNIVPTRRDCVELSGRMSCTFVFWATAALPPAEEKTAAVAPQPKGKR